MELKKPYYSYGEDDFENAREQQGGRTNHNQWIDVCKERAWGYLLGYSRRTIGKQLV